MQSNWNSRILLVVMPNFWKKVWYFVIKLNIYLSYNPVIFLGIFSRGMKANVPKRLLHKYS